MTKAEAGMLVAILGPLTDYEPFAKFADKHGMTTEDVLKYFKDQKTTPFSLFTKARKLADNEDGLVKTIKATLPLKLFGHKVTIREETVKIGCISLYHDEFRALVKEIESYKHLSAFTRIVLDQEIAYSNKYFTVEGKHWEYDRAMDTARQIVERLNHV